MPQKPFITCIAFIEVSLSQFIVFMLQLLQFLFYLPCLVLMAFLGCRSLSKPPSDSRSIHHTAEYAISCLRLHNLSSRHIIDTILVWHSLFQRCCVENHLRPFSAVLFWKLYFFLCFFYRYIFHLSQLILQARGLFRLGESSTALRSARVVQF